MIRRLFLSGAGALLTGACAGLSEEELRRRWPPLGQIIDVDGLAVHYWEQGEGQPVVLIHGASGNLRDWTYHLAPRLAERYRVIAFDRPGFGYSARLPERGWDPAEQASHLARATTRIGAERPIVVGHSWGGALAMGWAVRHGADTRGIVTLAGATMPWGGKLAFYYSLADSDLTGGLFSRLVNAVVSQDRIAGFLTETFEPQPVPEGYADYIGGPLATRPSTFRHNARDITRLEGILKQQSLSYPQVQIPVEILHGTADTTVWPEIHAQGMHALLPSSRLTLMDGVGHMPHHADAEAVVAAIDRLAARA